MADDTDDGSDVQQLQPGVTVTRTPGQVPVRKDSRSVMEMLRDEFNKHLGTQPKHQGRPIDDIVDDAVTGAKGASSEY